LAEIAFTATRMSRPFGSGMAASKSTSASLSSIGSDFWYPTAFILFSLGNSRGINCHLASTWQVL
jgi:hypothetical protein